MGRRRRLAEWWASARSTVIVNTWEGRFWLAVGLSGILFRQVRESIPVLFFISAYANVKGARSTAEAAKIEMREEEASE